MRRRVPHSDPQSRRLLLLRGGPPSHTRQLESGLLGEDLGLVGLQTGHVSVQMTFEHLQGDHCRDGRNVLVVKVLMADRFLIHENLET